MLKSMLGEGGKKFLNKNKNFNASIYKYNVYYGITITNEKQNTLFSIYKCTLYTEYSLTLWAWNTPRTAVQGLSYLRAVQGMVQPQRANTQHI